MWGLGSPSHQPTAARFGLPTLFVSFADLPDCDFLSPQGFKGGCAPEAQKAALSMIALLDGPEAVGAALTNAKQVVLGECAFMGQKTGES